MRRLKKILIMFLKIFLILAGLVILTMLATRLITGLYASSRIFSSTEVPAKRVAIVFGAGLSRGGNASPVLYDRVATAVDLYQSGKVQVLLMSGDNRFVDYNEPWVMRDVAISLGVPEDAIVLDYAGRRTYDTCYRARDIFQVDDVILVTQPFHLPRAIYLCNQLGVESIGVAADLRNFRKSILFYWNVREILATVNAMWEVHISHPVPVLGDPEPIFLEELP